MDAAKEIDVKVPVYVTAGFNYRISQRHPEWNEYSHEGKGPNRSPAVSSSSVSTRRTSTICAA